MTFIIQVEDERNKVKAAVFDCGFMPLTRKEKKPQSKFIPLVLHLNDENQVLNIEKNLSDDSKKTTILVLI